jgi:hypothetical protein
MKDQCQSCKIYKRNYKMLMNRYLRQLKASKKNKQNKAIADLIQVLESILPLLESYSGKPWVEAKRSALAAIAKATRA